MGLSIYSPDAKDFTKVRPAGNGRITGTIQLRFFVDRRCPRRLARALTRCKAKDGIAGKGECLGMTKKEPPGYPRYTFDIIMRMD